MTHFDPETDAMLPKVESISLVESWTNPKESYITHQLMTSEADELINKKVAKFKKLKVLSTGTS